MKRFALRLYTCLLISLPLIFTSCETDIDVSAEWKDITVVYGILDQNDSVHYLRINKAFLGDGNSLVYAKESDSTSYFNDLEVTLTEKGPEGQRVLNFDTIHGVGDTSGLFYHDPQILYESSFTMPEDINDNDYEYDLLIRNKLTGKEIRSSTAIVNSGVITTPRSGQRFIDFLLDNNLNVVWQTGKNARRYDVIIRFWYQEVMNFTDTTDRYFDWFIGSAKTDRLDGGEEKSVQYRPTALYDVAKIQIPRNDGKESEVTSRLTNKVEFTLVAGGDAMNTYIEVNSPSTGIVQDAPDYSNIQNGYGLLSSRYIQKVSIEVGAKTEAIFIGINELKFVDKLGN
ncbi:MAG TPA: hypothetical protein VK212_08795 [Lentimicrobium sp.]|nr:hypothetical protein [Lentimicrobium sp.]